MAPAIVAVVMRGSFEGIVEELRAPMSSCALAPRLCSARAWLRGRMHATPTDQRPSRSIGASIRPSDARGAQRSGPGRSNGSISPYRFHADVSSSVCGGDVGSGS